MTIMRRQGFTLTELMVGLVVGAIVILLIFAIGQVGTSFYSQLRSRSGVYDDAQFVIDFISGAVRRAASVPTLPTVHCLQVDTKYFYITGGNLVYGTASCGSSVNTAMITGVTGLVFDAGIYGQRVHVELSGVKGRTAFALSGDAMRRNP